MCAVIGVVLIKKCSLFIFNKRIRLLLIELFNTDLIIFLTHSDFQFVAFLLNLWACLSLIIIQRRSQFENLVSIMSGPLT